MTSPEARLAELGLELPPAPLPGMNRVPAVTAGDLVFLSGHGPAPRDGRPFTTGKVGRDLSLEEAGEGARLTGLHLLASLRAEIGSLDRVLRIVKILGMVNVAPGFSETPIVIDGCSDLLVEIFGPEVGSHARSAVGVAELPADLPVEIEMVVWIKPVSAP